MKRKIFFLIVLVMIVNLLSAQNTKVSFSSGGIINSFQDTRFSDIVFNKTSVKPEISFTRVSEKDYWLANASGYLFEDSFPDYDKVKISTAGYNVKVGYLRNVKPAFFLGTTWDIIDYIQRDNSELGNNSNFFKMSSDMFVSGRYQYVIINDWNLEGGIDYGLLSFLNSAPSFTTNFPQNVVDDGEVSFLDTDSRDPYNLHNMETKVFWNHFYLRTQIEVSYKRRFSLAYNWDVRSYSDHKGYPITNAMHSLMLRYHFVNHTKRR